jgi:hypothetical protein
MKIYEEKRKNWWDFLSVGNPISFAVVFPL